MTRATVRSVLVAAVLAAGSMMATTAPAADPKTSPALGEVFTAAQNALTAKRYAEVTAKAQEVLASPRKTADDTYAAYYFMLEVAKAQKDNAGIIAGLEGMLDSGFVAGPGVQSQFRIALVTANYQERNFAQAIKHGTDLIKSGGATENVYTVVGQSYYQTKNYVEAVKLFEGLVGNAEKSGGKPDRKQLALLQDAYAKAGNETAAQTTLEKLVRYYPTPDTWLVLLYEVKKEKLDPRQKLHLYRLMDATGNLKHSSDFTAYSDAATALGVPAEAHSVLDRGVKANAWAEATDVDRARRYMDSNKKRADAAQAELGKLEQEAKVAPTGNDFVALGMAQYSFGQYARSAEALKAALTKGTLKNPADAQIMLGTSLLKAGNKAEAAQVFKAVKADNPITQRIVKLWTLYAS